MTYPLHDPGVLRHRVLLQRFDRSAGDGAGGFKPAWTTLAKLPALVRPRFAVAGVNGFGLTSKQAFRVLIRFRQDIRVGDQMIYAGYALEIRSIVDEDGTGRWQLVDCETRP